MRTLVKLFRKLARDYIIQFCFTYLASGQLSITRFQFSTIFSHNTSKTSWYVLRKGRCRSFYPVLTTTCLNRLGIKPIGDPHKHLCSKLFEPIKSDPSHKIHNLLPTKHEAPNNLKRKRTFSIPRTHTNRAKILFIFSVSLDLFRLIVLVVYILVIFIWLGFYTVILNQLLYHALFNISHQR